MPLVLLPLPALAFNTGAPGIEELPSSNQARQSAETIDRAVGPGWEAPFVLVAATERGPITDRGTLALLAAGSGGSPPSPGVRAVIGPAPIAAPHRPAALARQQARRARARTALEQLERLGPGLRRAARRGRAAARRPRAQGPRAAACSPRAPNGPPPAPG